jgi:hypothetical protein
MTKIALDRVDMRKRGRPKLPDADVMPQISIRVPQWMLDGIDAVIEHERHGQGDRATLIREALAQFLRER